MLPNYHYSYLVGVIIFWVAWLVCAALGKTYRSEHPFTAHKWPRMGSSLCRTNRYANLSVVNDHTATRSGHRANGDDRRLRLYSRRRRRGTCT